MLWSGGAGIWHSHPATANDAPSRDGPSTRVGDCRDDDVRTARLVSVGAGWEQRLDG
jgi:hypothetical protein